MATEEDALLRSVVVILKEKIKIVADPDASVMVTELFFQLRV